MKILVLIIVVVIAAIILLVGVAALIGSRLSKSHTATRSIFLRQSPQNVYAVIRDFTAAPAWRSDVKRVEVQTQPDGKVRLREEGKNGTVNYELAEDVPGKRMVTRILDTDLGYSGKWTYVG
jgi:Polyketide cyclase / dehydrase and lipid transport